MSLLLQYTLIFASVLILVALGGCFSEHSGVINLGLEGIMIMGALGGALTMRYLGENSSHFVTILGNDPSLQIHWPGASMYLAPLIIRSFERKFA